MDGLTQKVDAQFDDLVDLRRDLHRHPERSSAETRTTKVLLEATTALGLEQLPCPTETGALLRLEGGRPGRTVLIRADIDALPITEYEGESFRSIHEGVMHACGHDGHAAALVGVAGALAAHAEALPGTYLVCFQPAEEGLHGAAAMVGGGLLEALGVDAVIGCHLASPAPVGIVGYKAGLSWAEANQFTITLSGLGGHGAMAPTDGNVILALANVVQRLAGVAEGLSYEGVGCSCSAGQVHAGTAANVIPDRAQLHGTLRTFDAASTREALNRLEQLCAEVAAEGGVVATVEFGGRTPAVENDPLVTEIAAACAREVVGEPGVLELPPVTTSDDMSEFLARVPGAYLLVGAGKADGSSGMHHHPGFSIDEAAIAVAAKVLASTAVALATPR